MSNTIIVTPAGFFQNNLATPAVIGDLQSTVEAAEANVSGAVAAEAQAVASAAQAAASATAADNSANAASTAETAAEAAVSSIGSAVSTSGTNASNAAASETAAASSATAAGNSETAAANSATAAAASATSAANSATSVTAGTGAFIPTGGTTARSLADQAGDVLNVKSFGAKLDGTSSDTAAYQAAYSAAKTGQTIYLPQGGFVGSVPTGGPSGGVIWKADGVVFGTGTSWVHGITDNDPIEWSPGGYTAIWKRVTKGNGSYATRQVNTEFSNTAGQPGFVSVGFRSDAQVDNVADAESVWAISGAVTTASTATTFIGGGAIGVAGHATRTVANPKNNIWAFYGVANASDGVKSSLGGGFAAIELDCNANDVDDGNGAFDGVQWGGRVGILISVNKVNSGGPAMQLGHGVLIGDAGGVNSVGAVFQAVGNFYQSVLDTRTATQLTGANSIWLNDGHTIAFDKDGLYTLSQGSGALSYNASGSEVFQIGPAGHVGIGGAYAAGVGLNIEGSLAVGFTTNSATLTGPALRIGANQTISFDNSDSLTIRLDSATGRVKIAQSGVDVFSIDASGNVRCKGTLTQSTTV